MCEQGRYIYLVLSDGENYENYIGSDAVLDYCHFIEDDRVVVRAKKYLEGVIIRRGHTVEELQRYVQENRPLTLIHRFHPFPSLTSSFVPMLNMADSDKQILTQATKTPRCSPMMRVGSISSINKNTSPPRPKLRSTYKMKKADKKKADKDLASENSTASGKPEKCLDKGKRKLVECVNTDPIEVNSDTSVFPQHKWYKYKRDIAINYRGIEEGTQTQPKTINTEGRLGTIEELLVTSTNERSDETRNLNPEPLAQIPNPAILCSAPVNNKNNFQNEVTPITNQNTPNLIETTGSPYQPQPVRYDSIQREYQGSERNAEMITDEQSSSQAKSRTASSARLPSIIGERCNISNRLNRDVEAQIYFRKYDRISTKYDKLKRQYQKIKITNMFLVQHVKSVTNLSHKLLSHLSPPDISLTGEKDKSSRLSTCGGIFNVSLSDTDESNSDDDSGDE